MQPKSILQSATVWGGISMLIGFGLHQMKVDVPSAQIDTAVAQVNQIIGLVSSLAGFVMVVWGRIRATRPVTLTGS